jgi:hypothetical protein
MDATLGTEGGRAARSAAALAGAVTAARSGLGRAPRGKKLGQGAAVKKNKALAGQGWRGEQALGALKRF